MNASRCVTARGKREVRSSVISITMVGNIIGRQNKDFSRKAVVAGSKGIPQEGIFSGDSI